MAFLVDCQARNLSPNTIRIYRANLLTFQSWLGVADPASVTAEHVRRFLVYLQESRNAGGLHQSYRVLRTFFRWLLAEGIIERNPIARVNAPRLSVQPLDPVPLSDLKKMLSVCERRTFRGDRDTAVLLTLLDTGCRASEFVSLDVCDVNPGTGAVIVRHAKGGKFRTAFIGSRSKRELMRYLRHRGFEQGPLWTNASGRRLAHAGLRQVLRRRAIEAGVAVPCIHSFRRAFALLSLRQGMDIYSLQKLMGHSDLSVLQRYLQQTTADLQAAHAKSGPVDHL